jgi:hypothetical protein
MAVTLTVNGVSFNYPSVDDENWGQAATQWAQAVTVGMLQKAGGTFTLTADVDFGASYGLKAIHKTRTANIAAAGEFRLANTDSINWRDAANAADLVLEVNPANNHLLFDGFDLSAASSSGNVIGAASSMDNALPRFDGITGQLLQNSGVIVDDSNNVTGVADLTISGNLASTGSTLNINDALTVAGTILPSTDSAFNLGSVSNNWVTLYLDNGATNGGAVAFNGGTSVLRSNAAGTDLSIEGFTAITASSASVTVGLAAPATPTANTLYINSIVKAWARVDSGGSIVADFNISSVSKSGTGFYTITLATPLNDTLIVPIGSALSSVHGASCNTLNASTCYVYTWLNATGVASDSAFTLVVLGA